MPEAASATTNIEVLQSQLADSLPKLDIDARKIEQVLNNLISNAIKFSPGQTRVNVTASLCDGILQIAVKDQGPGIPREEQERLFKPFSRTSVRPTGGESSTGLGLSISRNIVQAHGGRIWVEGEPGQGSRFVFTLTI